MPLKPETFRSILFFVGLGIWVILLLAEVISHFYGVVYTVPYSVHLVAVIISGVVYKEKPKELIDALMKKWKK